MCVSRISRPSTSWRCLSWLSLVGLVVRKVSGIISIVTGCVCSGSCSPK